MITSCVLTVDILLFFLYFFFFFKQKTAYELRISDWSSDVCSSDLHDQVHVRMVGGDRSRDLLHQHGLAGLGRRDDQRALALALRRHQVEDAAGDEIGRASCRERVCQYV